MSDKGPTPDDISVVDRRDLGESEILDPNTLRGSVHYRFVQTRNTQLARARLKGYRVVKPSETGERTLFEQEDAPAEDVIKHGDRVLMAAPMAKHKDNRRRVRDRAVRRLKSHDQQLRELAKERGIKIEDSEE